ncbi:MFS transporter [Shinella sp. G-2]|uniref:MFS transporter n=1 Tax=Shinella sp. G-2 TaxID=3133141 RepID=UPI003CFF5F35
MQSRRSLLLAALTVGAFAIGLDAYVILGALEAVMRDLAIAPATAGWIVSAYAFCYALFAPLNAWAFRHWSGRNLLILSAVIFSAGNLLAGLAPDFALLIAGRVVSAFGAAMFTPAATALATELLPPERKGFALSLIFGGMTVAQAAGVPLTAWIAATLDWRYAFFFVVVFGVIAALLLTGLLSGLPPGRIQPVAGEGRLALPGPVYGLLAVTFLIVTAEFAVYSYVSLLFAETALRGVPVLPAYGIGAVLGNVATGVLTDRVGPALVLFIAVGVQTLLLVALVLARAQAGLVVALAFLWGIVSYMYLVPIQHQLLERAAGMANLALAANSALIYVGIGTGSWIGGRVIEALGIQALAGTTAVLGGGALLVAMVFMRRR